MQAVRRSRRPPHEYRIHQSHWRIVMSYVGRLKPQSEQPIEPSSDGIDGFSNAIRALAVQHRPSRMPFFRNLAALDHAAAADPSFLGRIHLIYQAAMHATRAAVYFLPHLDSPALR